MLVLAKLGRDRAAYYLDHLAPTDEPGEGLLERPGEFRGRLADEVGLSGATVERAALERILAGRHPATGAVLHPAAARVRVAAYDLTFAAPKSVSLLHALGPAEAVAAVGAAHSEAVAAALGYLEAHAAAIRRRVGGIDRQHPASGLLAATFVHRTSRANEPHLHTHVLVANLAGVPGQGLQALDARPLYLHLRAAGALYDAGLRAGLRRELGVAFRPRAAAFEVAGLGDRLLEGFSSRRRQIAGELEASGRAGPRAATVAAARTRPAKDRSRSYPELVASWRGEAHRLGAADGRFAAVLGPAAGPADGHVGASGDRRPLGEPGRARAAVSAAREAFQAPFTRRELLMAAATGSRAGVVAGALEAAADEALVATAPEEALGARAAQLAGARGPLPAGRAEPRYRSARLHVLERRLAEAFEAARLAGVGEAGPRPGCPEVLRLSPGRPLESLAVLGERAREAAAAGLAVRAQAPTVKEALAFASLTGIPTTAGDLAPLPGPSSLVLVVAADRQPLSALDRLATVARARQGSLTLLVGPPLPGSPGSVGRALLLPVARTLAPARWRPEDLVRLEPGPFPALEPFAPSGRSGAAPGDGDLGTRGVPGRLEEAVGFALFELARRRQVGERAVLVAPDPAIATALDGLLGGPGGGRTGAGRPERCTEVVHLGGLEDRLEAGPVDALVVLGALPARPVGPPVVHLAVAPLGPFTRPFAERSLRLGRGRPDGRSPSVTREGAWEWSRRSTHRALERMPPPPSVEGRSLQG